MPKSIDPAVVNALGEAVRQLELCSSAEVAVEIRARSGSYAHADGRVAAAVAFLGLLALLLSPWTFHTIWVPVDVAGLFGIGLFVARRSDFLRRLVTTDRDRTARVRVHSAAAFVDRGIANTRERTGVLVYLSLLEAQIAVVADQGVLAGAPPLEWNQLVSAAHKDRAADLDTLRRLIDSLAPLLGSCLPCRNDDRNELPDLPRFLQE